MGRVLTFFDVAELYLADARRKNDKPSVVDAKQTILNRHVLAVLNDVQPRLVTAFHVDEVLERLEGLAPSTINNVVTVLRGLLLTAKRRGMAVPELYLRACRFPKRK